MKKIKIFGLVLSIALLVFGYSLAEEDGAAPKLQSVCPVMGGQINKAVYTDYEGRRIYFCCQGCIGGFEKNPAKYIKALNDEGVALEEASAVDHKKESDHSTHKGDGKHGACCGGCGSKNL